MLMGFFVVVVPTLAPQLQYFRACIHLCCCQPLYSTGSVNSVLLLPPLAAMGLHFEPTKLFC